MKFKMVHNNFNVTNIKESLGFYEEALGLKETGRLPGDGFVIVYIGNEESQHLLELTQVDQHSHKYNLGENEFHLAFQVDDYESAYRKHKEMGCICFENQEMGIYFIVDPDGYWLEILPESR